MEKLQATLADALLRSLAQLKEQKGALSLGDIGGIFMQVASSLNPSEEADQIMHREIARLAQYIAVAKKEILVISPEGKSAARFTDASLHLDEVIKASEKATHTIMDAAEAIQGAAMNLSGDEQKTIMDAANRIFEACNFQDINGQRINKVIKLLGTLEEGIARLNTLFHAEPEHISSGQAPDAGLQDDNALLNGPQFASQAPSQADIDKLFDTVGDKK